MLNIRCKGCGCNLSFGSGTGIMRCPNCDAIQVLPKISEPSAPRQDRRADGEIIEDLMTQARLFLEVGEWDSADECLEKVLDVDAEYTPAYTGKVQAAMKLQHESDLATCEAEYEGLPDWQKALRFATAEQKGVYEGYASSARALRGKKRKNLLKRAQLLMEDGDWTGAIEHLDKLLQMNPECAPAYVGRVQAAMKLRRESDLATCLRAYTSSEDWQKALRFATAEQKKVYEGYVAGASAAMAEKRSGEIYAKAVDALNAATTPEECRLAREQFNRILGFKDAKQQAEACLEKEDRLRYQAANERASAISKCPASESNASDLEELAAVFDGLRWGDSAGRAAFCRAQAQAMRETLYKRAKRRLDEADSPQDCDEAQSIFMQLRDFQDARAQAAACD